MEPDGKGTKYTAIAMYSEGESRKKHYRLAFSLAGCYVAARLAPRAPMRHALALGVVGIALSTLGAVANARMNLGPAWYAWSLVLLALPTAWLGGKLYEWRNPPLTT